MYRQVMVYAVRGNYDHDIIEGSCVTVKTVDGKEICGLLGCVESEYIVVFDTETEKEHQIEYSEIKSISHDS